MTTTAIQDITNEDICAAIREALAGGEVHPGVMETFLAEVDWSGFDTMAEERGVATRLGQLEEWTTELQEGDLTEREFRELLRSLLPNDEQGRRLGAVGA